MVHAALTIGRRHHRLSVNALAQVSGISRGVIYAMQEHPHVPRWPIAVALAAATGWRMGLVISPDSRRAPAITLAALAGHALPTRREISDYARASGTIIRRQAAVAVLYGLAERGWSLRTAARAAAMTPTKPSSLLSAASGPDLATLAQFLHPMGLSVEVWYQPWGSSAPSEQIEATPEAARRLCQVSRSAMALLARLVPELAGLIQDPDAATIAAAYAEHGSVGAAAEHLQVPPSWLRAEMSRLQLPVRVNTILPLPERRKRNRAMVRGARAGRTYNELATQHALSRARVHQIVQQHGIDGRALRRQQHLDSQRRLRRSAGH